MGFELVTQHGQGSGRRYAIADGGELTIGRSTACTVVVDDDGVSRRHCRLVNESDRLTAIDLGTLNSTFENGARVESGELIGTALKDRQGRPVKSLPSLPRACSEGCFLGA